jgi:predicted glycoside hydrolase/deacetylase ChbG (UPF0249 family)
MAKHIVLCADDYGQAPAISQGIIDLVEKRRLTAVSCLTTFPDWETQAAWLLPYGEQIDIGLHLSLTEGEPLSPLFKKTYGSFFSLPILMGLSCLRLLKKTVIEAEIEAQLAHFEQKIGHLPQFIDGHQHVHQFPVVRDALIKVYQEKLAHAQPYIRLVAANKPRQWNSKEWVLHAMGGRCMRALLVKHKIKHNQGFAGLYDFNANRFAEQFRLFLQKVSDGGLVMCHPGRADINSKDSLRMSRPLEHDYFLSDAFINACQEENVVLSRFK